MAKKRNRISVEMSRTIAESSPLIKKSKPISLSGNENNNSSEVLISELRINPFQPRININMQTLNELITSIEQNGLLQPIVVTEKKEDGFYTIVAGHRRCEAFKIMGKNAIPAIIMKNLDDKDLAVLSLTENLMRENLHPIENAIAMKNILDQEVVESQNKLAEYLGLSKGYISKLLNILKLPLVIIKTIKQDNYKDINILVLINKLKDQNQMLEAYNAIQDFTRLEAEKYIKSTYLAQKNSTNSIIDIKKSKSKINITIDIKKLSAENSEFITKEVDRLNKKIADLTSNSDS